MPDNTNIRLECLRTEDGDPWGVYAYGHIDPSLITLEMLSHELDYMGFDQIDMPIKVEHLWMYCEDDSGNTEYPWLWCEPDAEGAIAVTGVKFS